MSTYKPSVIFQSQINEIPNTSTSASAQASPDSVAGSTNPNDVSSIIGPNQPIQFQYSANNLFGGTPTNLTLSNDPNFQKDIISQVTQFICNGTVPEIPCSGSKASVIKSDNSISCGCPSNTDDDDYNFSDSDIQSILDKAQDILREAREKAFEEALNNSNFHDVINTLGSPDTNVQNIIDDVKNKVNETLKDRNYSMSRKAEETSWILEQTLTALIIADAPVNEGTEGAINELKETIGNITTSINNDCALNASVISPEIIKMVLGFNNKPEKSCSNGRVLDNDCKCVCPSGTVPCGYYECLTCPDGAYATYDIKWTITGLGPVCRCECPPGTVETFVGDPMAVPIPTWAGGPTEEEYRASAYACLPPCPEGMVRSPGGGPCKCRKNVGGWLFPKYELVDPDNCNSDPGSNPFRTGFTPNPKNNCECECLRTDGKKVYSNGQDERCRSICPDPLVYDWNSDSCVCPNPSECPAGQTKSPANNCLCSSGSYSYTNLTTSELAKIASNFGYSFNNNMELL